MRKHDPFDLDNLGHLFDDFLNDNFFYGNLDDLDHLLRWLRCRRHLCWRWRLLQRDSGGHSIIRVGPRIGDYRRVRYMTKESLGRRTTANNKMKGSKHHPLKNESHRIGHVGCNPKRVRLAIVVLVRGSDAKFWSMDET